MQRGQSQLFESLRVYLNNRRRLQPVIGLDSITECVTRGAATRELLYFCNVCVCRCSKADVRNHIFGSHHRFNYIKEWHPELLITWQEDNDLSAMAWPLMELAKKVEEKEGPGQAHLVEVAQALYQKMATLSEIEAVALVMLLRTRQTEVVSCGDTIAASRRPAEAGRAALPRGSERSVRDEAPLQKTSGVSSENSGGKPLIAGLLYVVEYRSDGGSSACFLCHCCRISSNKEDVVAHLTSSQHLISYLKETRPEQVDAAGADREQLQSLVQKVEDDDGRGALKVVNVPESLCKLLAAESYHRCLMILRDEWKNADAPENKDILTVPGVTEARRFAPRRNTGQPSTRKTKKTKSETETVFTVSLPLSGGPLHVERTSSIVDEDSLSPSADLDEIHFQEPGLFPGSDGYGDDASPCGPSHFRDDLHCGPEDVRMSRKNLIVTLFQDENISPSEDSSHGQHEDETETYAPRKDGDNHMLDFPETWRRDYYKCLNDSYDQSAGNGPMATASYTRWDGSDQHCYMSYLNGEPRAEEYADVGRGAQQYHQQPVCYQHTTGCSAARPAGVPYGPCDNFYDPVPHLNPARTRMQAQYGDNCTNNALTALELREQLYHTEQRPLQTDQGFDSYWA